MEKKRQKSLPRRKLGEKAEKLLLCTLPLVLLQAAGTAVYLAVLEPYALLCRLGTVSLLFDRLGLAVMLSVIGSLLYDLLVKRDEEK